MGTNYTLLVPNKEFINLFEWVIAVFLTRIDCMLYHDFFQPLFLGRCYVVRNQDTIDQVFLSVNSHFLLKRKIKMLIPLLFAAISLYI